MSLEKNALLTELLQHEWDLLIAAVSTLQLSVVKCQGIGLKEEYSFEELESFDSLTSKFNRTSDLFTQKVLRTAWMLLHEQYLPFIDMANRCEKIQLLKSADAIIEIRDLRNQIAHEYLPDAVRELVPEVIVQSARLVENINFCGDFLASRDWITT